MSVSGAPVAGPLRIRQATGGDRPALERMLDRCTGQTRYRRFHGPVNAFPERYLTEALSGSPVHFALVACADDVQDADGGPAAGSVVALASCRNVAEGVAELGILVEDAWQRRGIGGRLLREIAGHAHRRGLRALTAQVLADQAWIVRVLRGYGTCRAAYAGQALDVTLRLTGCTSCRPAAARCGSA